MNLKYSPREDFYKLITLENIAKVKSFATKEEFEQYYKSLQIIAETRRHFETENSKNVNERIQAIIQLRQNKSISGEQLAELTKKASTSKKYLFEDNQIILETVHNCNDFEKAISYTNFCTTEDYAKAYTYCKKMFEKYIAYNENVYEI